MWTKLAQAESLRRSSLCTASLGTTVYAFGGELKPRQPRDNVIHALDLPKGEQQHVDIRMISASQESPSPRVGAAMATLHDHIYMFSGRGGEAMAPIDESGGMWVFTPRSKSWKLVAPSSKDYPQARSYHCMAGDGEDTVYLHAGCPTEGRLSDLWAYSVSTAAWTHLASAPGPPRGGASIAFANGKLYRMNGFDGKQEQGGSLDSYQPHTNTWITSEFAADGKTGPGARSVSVLLPVRSGQSIFLVTMFGESDPSTLGHQGAGKMLDDTWVFSPETAQWRQLQYSRDNAPEGRGWFDADVVSTAEGEVIVVVGGLGEANNRLDDAWLLKFP